MTTHRSESATSASWHAATLLTNLDDDTLNEGRHHGFVRALTQMARAGRWHPFWCRIGDALDDIGDRMIAWVGIVLGVIVAVALGAVIGFAAGPIAAGGYVAAVTVAVALVMRMQRRTS